MLATTPEHIAVLHRAGFVSAHLPAAGRALRALGTAAAPCSQTPLPDFLTAWHLPCTAAACPPDGNTPKENY